MNDYSRQTQEFLAAAKEARIPEQVQTMVEDGVSKARETYSKVNSATKDSVKVLEEVMVAAHAGAKSIGEKVLRNTEANTEAVFEAAQAIARAKTVNEAVRLQTTFVQQQFATASFQTKELFELGTKVAQQTFETMNAAASKTFDQIKRAG